MRADRAGRLLTVLLILVGVTAASATLAGCDCGPTTVGAASVRDDGRYQVVVDEVVVVAASVGASGELDLVVDDNSPSDEPQTMSPDPSATTAQLDDGTMLELRGQSVVEISPNGNERLGFAYTDDERADQERNTEFCGGSATDGFDSIASDGATAIVTMGSQGLLVRSPDGLWTPEAVGHAEPANTSSFRLSESIRNLVVWFPALGVLVVSLAAAYWAKPNGRIAAAIWTVVGGLPLVGIARLVQFIYIDVADVDGFGQDRVRIVIALTTAVIVSISAWFVRSKAHQRASNHVPH